MCILGDEQPARMRGQEHDRNAREGGSWPLACCNSASTLWPAWPCPPWFLCLTSSQFSPLVGLGHSSQLLFPIYWKQEVIRHAGVRGPATMLLAEPMGIWLQ